MPVDYEDIMTHAMVEGDLGDYVHAGVAKLQRDHGNVGLAPLKEFATASLDLHFINRRDRE